MIRGNHDDPYYFNNKVFSYSNVELLEDYTILTVGNDNILCVGGAISIDRLYRLETDSKRVSNTLTQLLYDNPKATAAQLREAVIAIAGDIWNKYYAPLLGEPNCPLLGIYSHMVGYALYLPGYPIGQLVQFQLEEYLAKCKTPTEFAQEYTRIYQQGKLTPDAWMRGAVGESMSVEPILKAVRKAIDEK
jgi:hypothetical protein